MHQEPYYSVGSVILRRPLQADAAAIAAFHTRNLARLAPTSARRPPNFLREDYWVQRVAACDAQFQQDRGVAMNLFQEDGTMLGVVNLNNIVRGAFQSCDLGYAVDAAHEGKGLISWAVGRALEYAFGPLGLHRVQANHLPDNERSARLLARLGFRREGYAERFLLIDGQWRDHVLNAIVYDTWLPKAGEDYMLANPSSGGTVEYQFHSAPLAPELIERIFPVYGACFGSQPPEDFISRVEERTGSMLQLALFDGTVIGYKLGYRRNPEVFYSWLGGVLPAYRRRGIALELLRQQHAWCDSQGYRRVRTDTTNAFRNMLLLNFRAGFDVIGTYHDADRGLTIMLERALR